MANKKPKPRGVEIVRRFRDINQVMDDIEGEIAAIKDGVLSESKARIVAKNRQMQLQGIELVLQAARIEAKFRPALAERLGLADPTPASKTITQ